MMTTHFFYRYKLHHLLAWLVVYALWFYLRLESFSSVSLVAMVTAIKVLDLALVTYFASFVLVPRLLYRRRYGWFISSYILLILITSLYKLYIIGSLVTTGNFSIWNNFKVRFYDNVIPHFLLASTGVAIKLIYDYIQSQKQLAQLTREKADAEVKFLRSQINPHFLFNSINSVYFLIDKHNTEARDALHRFSEILRYQLYESQDAKIPLQKEIDFLFDYINLQKLRKGTDLQLHTEFDLHANGYMIEPLLLIPFVENAFKHSGMSPGGINKILVRGALENGWFNFTVNNSIGIAVHEVMNHGGIGLQNVQRRLELLYPAKHYLKLDNDGEQFTISLKLNLKE